MNPSGAPYRFFTSPASETLPVFSPDGRWIAYASDESGVNELYIRPFPMTDAKWQVSSSGTLVLMLDWIDAVQRRVTSSAPR